MEIENFKVGTKLEISLINENTGKNRSPYYPVKLQYINDDGTIEVDIPMSGRKSIFFRVKELVNVIITLEDGIYSFNAQVIGNENLKHSVLILKPVTEVQKTQRRDYYRLECNCVVKYRFIDTSTNQEKKIEEEINEQPFKTTNTRDISGGGMCIYTEEKIEKTNLLECVIILEKGITIKVIGQVLNSKQDDMAEWKRWKISIQFKKISEKEREEIINYIFQQQLQLRRKGLV